MDPVFHPGRPGHASGEAPMDSHWSQMLQCSDGRYVHGYGKTRPDCLSDARDKLDAAEYEIASPARDQIKMILARSKDRIYDEDIQRLLRLLSKIVLE